MKIKKVDVLLFIFQFLRKIFGEHIATFTTSDGFKVRIKGSFFEYDYIEFGQCTSAHFEKGDALVRTRVVYP